ncbi:MotA/TolQ/ExbB proton channel family protein [Flagellatimonas centrodinii]|uniref:MotA/TolQ/ExbB proton channel family protein n=1 Tax=Flagellatimonas centrodinii TaxID=2806210 RepID=UPI003F5025EC
MRQMDGGAAWPGLQVLALITGLAVVPWAAAQVPADAQPIVLPTPSAAAIDMTPTATPILLDNDSIPAAAFGELTPRTEQVDNPYGIKAAWTQGDMVSKSTFIVLLVMSLATWYILFVKLIEQEKLFRQSRKATEVFWSSASLEEGLTQLKPGSPFWYLADRGMSASQHHGGTMVERIDLHEWVSMTVTRATDEIGLRMQSGLAVLATVGSTAPFVGLFGTVWGIYHALTAIGISGQASIDKVAGPVGEALIMTALGLFVAVPAVMGYNWLVRRNKMAMEKVRAFATDLHAVLLSGGRVGDLKRPDAVATGGRAS